MSKWKIKLENIGRGKVTREKIVKAETLGDVEEIAIRECEKHLMSRDIDLCDKCGLTYTVTAGFRPVGKVLIETI